MLAIKRYFTDGLVQVAIMVSLLRIDLDTYRNVDDLYIPEYGDTVLGETSFYAQTQFHNHRNIIGGYATHPKHIERDNSAILRELQRLGEYERYRNRVQTDIIALLLNVHNPSTNSDSSSAEEQQDQENATQQNGATSGQEGNSNHHSHVTGDAGIENVFPNSDLTKEVYS